MWSLHTSWNRTGVRIMESFWKAFAELTAEMKRRLRDIAHKEMSKAVHKIDMKENARARATLKEISTLERRMRWFQHGVEKDLHSNLWWWVACLECKGEVQKMSSRLYEEAWEDTWESMLARKKFEA